LIWCLRNSLEKMHNLACPLLPDCWKSSLIIMRDMDQYRPCGRILEETDHPYRSSLMQGITGN